MRCRTVPVLACVGLCVTVVRGGVPPDTWKKSLGFHGKMARTAASRNDERDGGASARHPTSLAARTRSARVRNGVSTRPRTFQSRFPRRLGK